MSADNYITIRKEGKVFVGYMQFCLGEEDQYERALFMADTIERAVRLVQEEDIEYGYHFVDL